MATFEQVRAARQLSLETQIAAILTANPNELIDSLWAQWTQLASSSSSGGGGGGDASAANQQSSLVLLQDILAQLRDDQAIAPQLWTDDSGAYYYRTAAYDENAGQFVFANVDLSGASYTPDTNPRPFGGEQTADRDIQLQPALYDAAGSTDLPGFVQILYDHSTNPTTVSQLGILDSSYTPVAAPTNIRERAVSSANSFWQISEGTTGVAVSTNNATNTQITIPAGLASVSDEDIQATVSVNANAQVKLAAAGASVPNLSQVMAEQILNDTLRWGVDGETLTADRGEKLNPENGQLTITGRQNIQAFRCHATSVDFPPNLNVKFYVRSA